MHADRIEGKWKQLTGRITSEWGKLTDDDLSVVEGHRDYLVGKLQQRYGIARGAAEAKVCEFEQTL